MKTCSFKTFSGFWHMVAGLSCWIGQSCSQNHLDHLASLWWSIKERPTSLRV